MIDKILNHSLELIRWNLSHSDSPIDGWMTWQKKVDERMLIYYLVNLVGINQGTGSSGFIGWQCDRCTLMDTLHRMLIERLETIPSNQALAIGQVCRYHNRRIRQKDKHHIIIALLFKQ